MTLAVVNGRGLSPFSGVADVSRPKVVAVGFCSRRLIVEGAPNFEGRPQMEMLRDADASCISIASTCPTVC